jgi:hypothetical protein
VAEVVQCTEAVSIKSTIVTNLDQWKTTYASHLQSLVDRMGASGGGFAGKNKNIIYDKARVVIAVPEGNLSAVSAWKAAQGQTHENRG